MKNKTKVLAALAIALGATTAQADGDYPFGLELEGTLGDNGFQKYVPPVMNLAFNETPHITTEVRPFIAYHDIPNDFLLGLTDGGRVISAGVQLRAAITERFGLIATLDGYTDIGFDEVLSDDAGFNDLAFGAKYAFLYNPDEGYIASLGLRYFAPVGNLNTGIRGTDINIDLNGEGSGYINPFITGRYDIGDFGLQASVGGQIALSDESWSFVHASAHVDYEVMPGIFPFAEFNIFAPVDGGDSVVNDLGLDELTGADIVDVGGSDPVDIINIGGGARFRLSDNALIGIGVEGNVSGDREDSVYGWRFIADAVIHF